jgi:AraC-like DNA-binding protein
MAKFPESHFLVRLGALSEIDRTLGELGVDPEPLLAAHGMSSRMLEEGDSLVTVEQAAALLEHAARETDCPNFAIELASRQSVNLLGAIGLLLQTADTVREALQDVERYLRTTHVSHIHWTLVRRGEFDAFEISVELPTLTSDQIRLVNELGVAQCYRIMQSVSSNRLDIASVCFRHGDDQSLSRLRRFFSAPVQVAAEFDGLLFAPGTIDLKVTRADSQAHQSLRRLILAQENSLSVDSLAEQVKILIRPLLPTGQCSIERIARCFAWEKRTLQRYLREDSNTTYQQLLDGVRFETACFYLKESELPVIQVSLLAGFSEPTNFSRAFRRRFGVSPREWRQSRKGPTRSSRLSRFHR